MTSYIAITNAETDPNSPITADLMTKLKDNPVAIAEGDVSAPFSVASWQPYNHLTGGDGSIYSFSTNGAVESFETPNFADDYEYMFIFDKVSTTGSSTYITLSLYLETSGAYTGVRNIYGPTSPSASTHGNVTIHYPKKTLRAHFASSNLVDGTTNSEVNPSSLEHAYIHNTSQKISKAKFNAASSAGVTFDAGVVYMYHRRVKF